MAFLGAGDVRAARLRTCAAHYLIRIKEALVEAGLLFVRVCSPKITH